MFHAEKDGEYEPNKVRRKEKTVTTNGAQQNGDHDGAQQQQEQKPEIPATNGDDEPEYEEDIISEEGAIWPIQNGNIVDWPCFFALMDHIYRTINPPFHTAILLVAEPVWTPKHHEAITQFFFEKYKMPAFGLIDAASATVYAYGLHTATVVDVGHTKADVTAISEFLIHDTGRALSVPSCGGEAMTERLRELLAAKRFSRDMCEQLKKSPICEILPPEVPMPSADPVDPAVAANPVATNPAAAASTGLDESGHAQNTTSGAVGEVPRGPGPGTEVGTESKPGEDNEGVLDIASIVTGGNMNEFLERKEREKADKAAAKKKGADAASAAAKPVRLANSRRLKNSFFFEDHALHNALKDMNVHGQDLANMQAAMDSSAKRSDQTGEDGDQATTDGANTDDRTPQGGAIRREIEVGLERFQAASGGILDRLAQVIYRTITSVEEVNKRSELWDSLIIVGNGSKVRGFKEALLATIQNKYIISPSSATIFTSELPSNLSTPMATGSNTPQPQAMPHAGPGVNPLLYAATTAQNPQLNSLSQGMPSQLSHSMHSSHAQTPTSLKLAKMPEYFPEWKDVGYEEAVFLGAQVAAKVLFITDQGSSKGYMTRTDYNEQGPQGIHDYSL